MRSIAEIYASIVADKDSQSSIQALAPTADTEQQLLVDLNTSSKVAIWRLWVYIISVAIHTHEYLWDVFLGEVQAIADSAIVGTVRWYQDRVFAYQHGDVLAYDSATGKYTYAGDEPTLRIVKRCAVIEQQDGNLAFKVAKLDNSQQPIPLSGPEQTGLAAYLKKVRFAGTKFILLSGNGDILRVQATVYYDGVVPIGVITSAVKVAIAAYVGQLPFNGEFLLSALTDKIQVIGGVVDVVLTSIQTKSIPANPYELITRIHVPIYGYYRIDDSVGNTLDDTLTFVVQ